MRTYIFTALFVTMVSVTPASADLILTIGNTNISAGGTSTVDVYARSDNATGDLVDTFGLDVRITKSSGTGLLKFTDPQQASELLNSLYIFDTNSLNQTYGAGSSIASSITLKDTYLGGDGTVNGLGVSLGSTDKLLASLSLDATSAKAGDIYQISVYGNGAGNGTTFFANPDLSTYYNWRANTTSITVASSGVSALPEPSSWVMMILGVASLTTFLVIRKRFEPSLCPIQ